MGREEFRNTYVERRDWQWVDWALFGIFTVWLAMGILFVSMKPQFGGWTEKLTIMLFLAVSYFAPLAFWRPGYTNRAALPFTVLLTSGALELYLTGLYGKDPVSVVSVLLIILGFHARGKLHAFHIIVFILGLPLIEDQFLLDQSFDVARLINGILSYGSLYAIGYGIQRMWASNHGIKKLYEENLRQYQLIQEQNKALEQYSYQVEKLTLLEERNRMARELHDTVGHTFTSVIMGMDAVSYLMDAAPDKAKEKLDVLRSVTRNGLEEVRRSIHQIAPQEDEGPFQQQLSRLANEFSVHTGTQVKLNQTGEECELPKQAQLTLIRCLQEALTNAKRHGRAGFIQVGLHYGKGHVSLQVEDDGIGAKQLVAGFGLTAMQERLGALQGQLDVVSMPGTGTVVTSKIPIRRQNELRGN